MNREQMIAWLTLEGWVPVKGGTQDLAHWVENPQYGAVYSYFVADFMEWTTDFVEGWLHDNENCGAGAQYYMPESWSNFPAADIALIYDMGIERCMCK